MVILLLGIFTLIIVIGLVLLIFINYKFLEKNKIIMISAISLIVIFILGFVFYIVFNFLSALSGGYLKSYGNISYDLGNIEKEMYYLDGKEINYDGSYRTYKLKEAQYKDIEKKLEYKKKNEEGNIEGLLSISSNEYVEVTLLKDNKIEIIGMLTDCGDERDEYNYKAIWLLIPSYFEYDIERNKDSIIIKNYDKELIDVMEKSLIETFEEGEIYTYIVEDDARESKRMYFSLKDNKIIFSEQRDVVEDYISK